MIKNIFSKFAPNIYFDSRQLEKLYKQDKKLFRKNSHLKLNEGSVLDNSQKLWRRANSLILGGNSLVSKNPNMFLPEKWPTYFSKSKRLQCMGFKKRRDI